MQKLSRPPAIVLVVRDIAAGVKASDGDAGAAVLTKAAVDIAAQQPDDEVINRDMLENCDGPAATRLVDVLRGFGSKRQCA